MTGAEYAFLAGIAFGLCGALAFVMLLDLWGER